MKNGIDRAAQATKGDLQDLAERILDRVRGDLLSLEERVLKAIGDTATELAKAFFHFTESNQIRATQLEANQAALIARISTLEARLTDLEKRLNFPNLPTDEKPQ
jgi:hypothetical protein